MTFPPEHMSYSALKQYEDCPRAWYLSRYREAEQKMTWFFPLGTTVHKSIEAYIATGDVPKFESIFYPLVAEQMKVDSNDMNWLSGGPFYDPTIRGRAVEVGKICVENAVKFLDDMDVWEVEFDATGYLPGCEVPIKAFVDIIGEHKKHGPCIPDWKSGKQKPKDTLQLETYEKLLASNYNFEPHPTVGLWVMLHPDAAKARPIKLDKFTAEELGARYQKAYEQIKKKIWKPNPGFGCKFCIMAPNCNVESPGSARSKYYDHSSEDGIPF